VGNRCLKAHVWRARAHSIPSVLVFDESKFPLFVTQANKVRDVDARCTYTDRDCMRTNLCIVKRRNQSRMHCYNQP
jgi:hypothetical protein